GQMVVVVDENGEVLEVRLGHGLGEGYRRRPERDVLRYQLRRRGRTSGEADDRHFGARHARIAAVVIKITRASGQDVTPFDQKGSLRVPGIALHVLPSVRQ